MLSMSGFDNLSSLTKKGKLGLAKALAQIECSPDSEETVTLLDAAYKSPVGHVIGITGPPGVGKSTLLNVLINSWRIQDRTVGIIAVDPSSRVSGGALLGDRTRLLTDPNDQGIFIRSMAARDKLGGLATLTITSMVLMRALYNTVVIETVGVGQSETDIVKVADTVLFCVQPGSGDSLQFMKAGIIEIPHIVLVTKADMGEQALRAKADVQAALALAESDQNNVLENWNVPVILVSSVNKQGIEQVINSIETHITHLRTGKFLDRNRQVQAKQWLVETIRERFGLEGIKRIGNISLPKEQSPFRELQKLQKVLY